MTGSTSAYGRRAHPWWCAAALGALALLCAWAAAPAAAGPLTRLSHTPGELVPIPAAVPHQEGSMVDRRIVPNLRWLAKRFPIYVTEGYSGKLPGGGRVGCRGCHVKRSDHYNGLAVDVVALRGSGRCDGAWRGVTRLARWAEPRRDRPRPPFRWVGYDGDRGHGCGHHLHLSWEHAPARSFQLAEWVEVFAVRFQDVAGGPRPERAAPQRPAADARKGPRGGVSAVRSGGVSSSRR